MQRNHWIAAMVLSVIGCLTLAERTQILVHAANPAVQAITMRQVSPSGPLGDTQQLVLAPDGSSVTSLGGAMSDEHSTVFPPGSLGTNSGYLFFVASGSKNVPNPSIGALPLISVRGKDPDKNGQWTLKYSDEWGAYVATTGCQSPLLFCYIYGDVFLSPHVEHVNSNNCPSNDTTFDLSYAAPGSVVVDPTAPGGHLLMVYEGVNGCVGPNRQHPIDIGIATSDDFGRSWPSYCGSPNTCGDATPPNYEFYNLPGSQNPNQGPDRPAGAWGNHVCTGNYCNGNSQVYGRYRILNQEGGIPSAFVDDLSGGTPYLYVVHGTPGGDLSVSRVLLNHETKRLTDVENWNGTGWCLDSATSGCDPTPGPILKPADPEQCGGPEQRRWQGSISYVDQTQQYLLTFVCESKGDPASGQSGSKGEAWFWSTTSNLSTQVWTVEGKNGHTKQAVEITNTWNPVDICTVYNGWYPTFMSLSPAQSGHLSSTGYVFYMWGNLGRCTTKTPRQYASRAFTMTIN